MRPEVFFAWSGIDSVSNAACASLSLQRLQSVQALLDGSESCADLPEVLTDIRFGGDYSQPTPAMSSNQYSTNGLESTNDSTLVNSDLPARAISATLFNHVDTPFLNNALTSNNQLNTTFTQQLLTYTAPDTAFLFYFSSLLTYEDFGLNFSPAVKELMQKTFSYASYRYFSLLHGYESTAFGFTTDTRRLLDNSADFSLFLFFDQASRFYSSTLLAPFQHQLTSKSTMLTTDESISTARSD